MPEFNRFGIRSVKVQGSATEIAQFALGDLTLTL